MFIIGIPVGSTLVKFNLGALLHSIGERLPNKWIPESQPGHAPYWELAPPSYCSQLTGQKHTYCVHGLPGLARLPLWESSQTLRWKTEHFLATSNQPTSAFISSSRVLDQEIIPAPALLLPLSGVSLLHQLALSSLIMSAAKGKLSLVSSVSSYDFSKLGFAYLIILGLSEQLISHIEVWRPWATAANYVMKMTPVICWAFQA
ncbi:hypothetical protein DSO57_1001275 [Entomophthora muscae]|uniref:Uncharacterized protein n=1 Tax=Entomophthora muscae TaxID=34485 RepID=A0ACC2T9R6_9FUNG|nr:hypothetical protein DSO57_1001275 [Entomophthora muscae]